MTNKLAHISQNMAFFIESPLLLVLLYALMCASQMPWWSWFVYWGYVVCYVVGNSIDLCLLNFGEAAAELDRHTDRNLDKNG